MKTASKLSSKGPKTKKQRTKPTTSVSTKLAPHKLAKADQVTAEDEKAINKLLQDHGICVFGPFKEKPWVDETINEIKHHLESQPRVPEFKIDLKKTSNLSKPEIEHLKKCWVPHVTFGAPCEAPAYHLKKAWELRQDPSLYKLFTHLLGDKDLRVNIDRYKAKLPGTGEREFCHWDSNPWKWDHKTTNVQGIFALTPIEFVCVPNTHTEEFAKKFKEQYKDKVQPDTLTLLNPEDDPMELNKKEEIFKVPSGYFVIWSDKLLHSSYPNKTQDIKFALYLSWCRKVDCVLSDQMRAESYLTGKAPPLQPSGFKFSIMPTAWVRYTKLAEHYHQRLPVDRREFRTSAEGKKYPIITEHVPSYYIPPPLTELGYRLLWGNPNHPSLKRKRDNETVEASSKRPKV